jgi:hypothetical protein
VGELGAVRLERVTRLVGLLGFGAAAWKTGPRDAWIGWSRAQRQRNLGGVVNHARFLGNRSCVTLPPASMQS